MDKFDNLMIRAIKSNRCGIELYRKVHARRVDMRPEHIEDHDIGRWLIQIVENYKLYKMEDLMFDMMEEADWRYAYSRSPKAETYWERVIQRLSSKIRLTEVSKLLGYVAPLRFRIKRNK